LHNEKLNLNNNKGAIAATCCLIDSGTSDSYQWPKTLEGVSYRGTKEYNVPKHGI
jgi:hypothetical protein